ncbi:hypothetical protein KM043_014043 [Ampulex compressa]|nr:hypothetical protein KM043_014043 [Ampulex compressa]
MLLKRYHCELGATMMFNARLLLVLGLATCGVLARSADNRDFQKESFSQKGAGSMLAEIAKELVQRSTSSSQVLNLNLSNLLLLLVLKAVVFGAGYIGHHGYKARDLEEENVISEGEIALALGYLIGDTCLYRAACEEPHVAKEYLGAAEMIMQTMKLLPQTLPIEGRYEKTLAEFRKAIEYGASFQCPPEYSCKKENIKKFLKSEKE